MKIAMVSMNAGPLAYLGVADAGGQSVVVNCLSRALSLLGNSVTIYTQRDEPSMPRCLTTSSGVHVDYIDVPATLSPSAPALFDSIAAFGARLLEEWTIDPPDIIHAHSWMSGKAVAGAARSLGIPVVVTFHGLGRVVRRRGDSDPIAPLRAQEEIALVRSAARVIATSSAEVFALLRMGGNPGAIKLIPCGVDLDAFSPLAQSAARDSRPFRVATLSRLVADAGVGDVIEALAYVAGVELTVGGGRCNSHDVLIDPDAEALATLATARGVGDRVTFVGRVKRDDVASFLRLADVVVCAPWHDSTGSVMLEAMACGVPVIVSAVGALVDAVADGLTGTHVPAQAPRQLAYAIGALKDDLPRCRRYGRLGVERATARHGWSRIGAETYEVYRSVAVPSAYAGRTHA